IGPSASVAPGPAPSPSPVSPTLSVPRQCVAFVVPDRLASFGAISPANVLNHPDTSPTHLPAGGAGGPGSGPGAATERSSPSALESFVSASLASFGAPGGAPVSAAFSRPAISAL